MPWQEHINKMKKNYYSVAEIAEKIGLDPKKIIKEYWRLENRFTGAHRKAIGITKTLTTVYDDNWEKCIDYYMHRKILKIIICNFKPWLNLSFIK